MLHTILLLDNAIPAGSGIIFHYNGAHGQSSKVNSESGVVKLQVRVNEAMPQDIHVETGD